jgi:Flp pilus assembly protein TadD
MCRFVASCRLKLELLSALLLLLFANISPVRAGEPEWVEVQSPNFSVITDAGEKRGREAAMRFEQMRAVFGTLITQAKVSLPVPLQIVAFRNTKELRQVAPLFHGKPTQVAGLFQAGGDRSFIMLDMSDENPWTVVFHEYAHQLMNANLKDPYDPWFEEGFAEYFSSIEVDGKQAQVGRVPHEDYLILQQVGMMKVADLFKVQHYSETYNDNGNNRTIFYAEAGMLLHYIYDHQLLPRVAVYFEARDNKHASVEDAMQQAFALSPAQFDKTLRDYVQSGRYRYYAIPAPAKISEKTYTARALSKADANAVIADIHLHSLDHHEQAVTEFQEVLKADPNNAAACRGLGYFYLEKQDYSQAAEYFQRASQFDSKDPRVHYYNALLMARQSGFSSTADLPSLTREIETSISLDPNFADSYALLAFAQTTSGDPAKAVETMAKAITLDPRNENYRFNLAKIYLANHQMDKARAVLEALRTASNPGIAASAETALSSMQQVEQEPQEQSDPTAVTLVRRGAPEPARSSDTNTPSPKSEPAKWGAPIFIHGILKRVDCSTEPTAQLNVTSGSKTLSLKVADKNRVILMGADHFSCSWSNQKVAVNYRQNDSGETSVMSVELQ